MAFNGHHTKEAIEKIRAFQKNKVVSEETKKKLSKIFLGRKTNRIPRSAFKKGSIPWNKGQKNVFSPETIMKMSLARKNFVPANKGKKASIETRLKQKERALERYKVKENHPRWKEDRNSLYKSEKKHEDTKYRYWMKEVKDRDGWKCKINNKNCKGRLEAHHILNWVDYPELRYEINNGITLCQAHHPRGRANEKRLSPYFMELVSVSKE